MSEHDKSSGNPSDESPKSKPANAAPDAVMDPNEKTEGHPGKGPQGGASKDEDADPGGG